MKSSMPVKLIDLKLIINLPTHYLVELLLKKTILVTTTFLKPSSNGNLIHTPSSTLVELSSMKSPTLLVTILDWKLLRFIQSSNIFLNHKIEDQLTIDRVYTSLAVLSND